MNRLKRRLNQADIAAQLGVSVSTVSRALANESGISEAVRHDVQKVARSLGYRSKHPGPAPAERRAVALVPLSSATSAMGNFYFGIIEGMRSAAEEFGLALDLRLVNESLVTLDQVKRHLLQAEAGGVLLAGIDPWEELVDWCKANATPAVLVNGSDPLMRFSSVAPANFYGAYLATQRLLDAGHRSILHYTNRSRPTILERRRGFEAAMAATPGARATVVSTAERRPGELLEDLVAGHHEATALFCWNDIAALEMLEGLHAEGSPLPPYFSLVGFDDLPLAGMTTPRLSTMRVNREAIGTRAVRLLIDHMEGRADIQQIEIGVSCVEGQTVFHLPP